MAGHQNRVLAGAALVAALTFLGTWEGDKREAYQDIGGVWTICSGSTQNVQEGQKATQEDCWEMTLQDYRHAEKAVLEGIHVPLGPSQQLALTSLCYNVGNHACKTSTLFNRINAGECRWAAWEEFPRWNKVKGVEVQGLTNRRFAEASVFVRECHD